MCDVKYPCIDNNIIGVSCVDCGIGILLDDCFQSTVLLNCITVCRIVTASAW